MHAVVQHLLVVEDVVDQILDGGWKLADVVARRLHRFERLKDGP